MIHLTKILAVVVVVSNLVKHATAQAKGVKPGDNGEQFSLLCRIYNVAKNPPISYADTQDFMKAFEVINAINASLAAEEWFNEIEKATGHDNISEDFKKAHPDYEKQWDAWKTAVTKVSSGNEYSRVKPTTREAKLAQIRLRKISRKAHKIIEEIRKVNITKEVRRAESNFYQVIFGDGGNEINLCNATVKDVRGREGACGAAGLSIKGSHAGKNLVVDFMCLCASIYQGSDSRGPGVTTEACGVKVGGTELTGFSDGVAGSGILWAGVKGGCSKNIGHAPKSVKEARAAIEEFLSHLATGGVWMGATTGKGNGRKPGMLGIAASVKGKKGGALAEPDDLVCNGEKGDSKAGGICVYYGPSKSDWKEIPWLKKFETGLDTLEALGKTVSLHENLEMLQSRAEEIYEEAKATFDLENTDQIQKTTETLTEHNTTHSRSHQPCLFLPLALLI